MELNVLYFAHVRERTGRASETLVCADGATVREVVALLAARYPTLAALLPTTRVAVDGELVGLDAPVHDGAELVLIPPVAGGSGTPRVALTEAPLDAGTLAALDALVSGPAQGAVATFSGVVRDHARGRQVTSLDYEAYGPMALRQMERICAAIEAEIPGVRLVIHHRVGHLEVGEVAVQAAASAPHRAEAFRALAALVDRLKQEVPIWKREHGPGGAEWVTERP
jgi:molybdopterin synthase catalytic subunit